MLVPPVSIKIKMMLLLQCYSGDKSQHKYLLLQPPEGAALWHSTWAGGLQAKVCIHSSSFSWSWCTFLPLSYKAIVNILRHFLFQVLCGSNSDFLWKDNPKFAMGCYAKPFSMSHKATPAAVINRPRGHTKCQLWAYASILSINIIINTSTINVINS